MGVTERFTGFLNNISLSDAQRADGETRHKNVRQRLNFHYYNSSSETANSRLVGSWGKETRVRPPRDIDILFELPKSVYDRYQGRTGNKQSQLLQEVRDVLLKSFPNTAIKGDGPAVVIPFSSGFKVELVPAFLLNGGQYWICITKDGGSYKTFDPTAEIEHVRTSSTRSLGKTRDIIRMAKTWQRVCSPSVKSFYLELMAVNFLSSWEHFDKSKFYYDYLARDYFGYIKDRDWTSLYVPGTGESMLIDGSWKSKAQTAHDRAVKACELEAANKDYDAGVEWQKIFGTDIPLTT